MKRGSVATGANPPAALPSPDVRPSRRSLALCLGVAGVLAAVLLWPARDPAPAGVLAPATPGAPADPPEGLTPAPPRARPKTRASKRPPRRAKRHRRRKAAGGAEAGRRAATPPPFPNT